MQREKPRPTPGVTRHFPQRNSLKINKMEFRQGEGLATNTTSEPFHSGPESPAKTRPWPRFLFSGPTPDSIPFHCVPGVPGGERSGPRNLNSRLGGAGRPPGREDDGRVGQAVRYPPESDCRLEGPAASNAASVFGQEGRPAEPPVDLKALHAKIGELTLENVFLEGALNKAGLLSAKR